ncbi:hypothetical protein [Micromonospora sp. NPDC050495]|uniref:hypothetical protein n=1 Tax=Micromonospora sp. NPDC050495 TaxID=3154936 RepID=UPI0033FBF731
MRYLGNTALQVLAQLPTLLVLAVGLVLALVNRRLPRGPRGLLLGGVAVLLVGAAVSLLWSLTISRSLGAGWSSTELIRLSMLIGLIQLVLHPLGLALVIAAALAGRRATGPDAPPPAWAGWPYPPGTPPAGAAPYPPSPPHEPA